MVDSKDAPPAKLAEAALICSQSWSQVATMPFDPLISFKLFLWRLRIKKKVKSISQFQAELQAFTDYRNSGSMAFAPSEFADKPDSSFAPSKPKPPRGTPPLLILQQFLIVQLRFTDEQAWDHPYGLAMMRWQAHWEGEGAFSVYNEWDNKRDSYISKEEALRIIKEDSCRA